MVKRGDIRHNCNNGQRCYLTTTKERIELLNTQAMAEHRITFGDIDGFMERNGYCLFVEWKSQESGLKTGPLGATIYEPPQGTGGQYLALTRLTLLSRKIWVLFGWGDPQTMQPRHLMWLHLGNQTHVPHQNIHTLIDDWFDQADRGIL